MVLSGAGCPWKDHLFELEQERPSTPLVKYALFADNNGGWRVQCVPATKNSFENRLELLYMSMLMSMSIIHLYVSAELRYWHQR